MKDLYEKKDITLFDSECDKFVYEVKIYRIYPLPHYRFELYDSSYIATNKEVKKGKTCFRKKFDDFELVKYIEFYAAPLSYLEENHFKKVEEKNDKRKSRKKKKNNE